MSRCPNQRELRDGGSDDEDRAEALKCSEPLKTVRCVIVKDVCETWRKLGSGDGGPAPRSPPQRPPRPRAEEAPPPVAVAARREKSRVAVTPDPGDEARLKNHMEWMRQKEIECARKREAERLEEERKKEEKEREEKEKRRREKEKEEKLREWQEQKAREKEEKKREEVMLKALEREIKGVTQTLDKEKLIHEWIRIKNKQRQLEAEKKAELMRKEEETRALRQSLAEISYRQWKERTKSRRIALPKNGYQIFGPKPAPVVKEDWNHDFINGDDLDKGNSARTSRSTASFTTIRGSSVSRTEFPVRSCLGDLHQKSPSSCQLKVVRSRTSVTDLDLRLPFRELLGPGAGSGWGSLENVTSAPRRELRRQDEKGARPNPSEGRSGANATRCNSKLFNVADVLPTKNKLDIYLRSSDWGDGPAGDKPRKPKTKPEDNLKSYLQGLGEVNSKLLLNISEKLSASRDKPRDKAPREAVPGPANRRCRSYDKTDKKPFAARSSSMTMTAVQQDKDAGDGKKPKKANARAGEKTAKVDADAVKARRKPKKAVKPDACPLVDSPYCARKAKTKKKTRKEDREE